MAKKQDDIVLAAEAAEIKGFSEPVDPGLTLVSAGLLVMVALGLARRVVVRPLKDMAASMESLAAEREETESGRRPRAPAARRRRSGGNRGRW